MADIIEALAKVVAKGKRPIIKAHQRGDGPAWPGRSAAPSYTRAACGWTGRTRYLRLHRIEAGHGVERAWRV